MSKRIDRSQYLSERDRRDSHDNRMINHEDVKRDRLSKKANTLFSVFNSVGAASESSGSEREEHLQRAMDAGSTDPELMDRLFAFMMASDEQDDENPLFAEIQEQLLEAADSYSGIVPDDFRLEPELQAYFDQSEELQAYKESLPEIVGTHFVSHYDRTRATLKRRVAEIITWLEPTWPTHLAAQQQPHWVAIRSRDADDADQTWREKETRGEIEGSAWMLERRLIGSEKPNIWRVEFRLVGIDGDDEVYAPCEEWQIEVLDGDTELATSTSLYDDETRELKGTFSEEEIMGHRVVVTEYPN